MTSRPRPAAGANANAKAAKIWYDTKASEGEGKWIFDKKQVAYNQKVHESSIGSESGKTSVYHVSPTYEAQGFVTIVTPICYCSGLYIQTDNVTGKKSITMCIWMYRDWNDKMKKKKAFEEKHEALWRELHECCSLLDTEPYATVRSTIGIPKTNEKGKPVKMAKVLRPFVTLPTYRKGHKLAGELDPDRPPRVKASVWLGKLKTEAAAPASANVGASAPPALRALPSGDRAGGNDKEQVWEGQRLLCKYVRLDKTPLTLADLLGQPFMAQFTLIWLNEFIGGYKNHQLKASIIAVTEFCPKTSRNDMTDEDFDDLREQAAQYQQERENEEGSTPPALSAAINKEEQPNEDGEEGGETAPPLAPPKAKTDKGKKKKMDVAEVLDDGDE